MLPITPSIDQLGRIIGAVAAPAFPLEPRKFPLAPSGKSPLPARPVSPRSRGALRGRHERWVWNAVDVPVRSDETHRCGRRSRVVLTPRRWRQVLEKLTLLWMTGARKPDPRGDHEGNRKTIAQGMPADVGVPVVTCSCAFLFAREAMGASCTRHSLRPPLSEDVTKATTWTQFASRECELLLFDRLIRNLWRTVISGARVKRANYGAQLRT